MVELYLIRHGKTYGNTLGRYIGTTDESLCEEGVKALREGVFPKVELVYASPLKRCRETAQHIWPELASEASLKICEKLRECDFGDFENQNYKELSGNPEYQRWIDSGGTLPFPGGESHEAFKARCREGFLEVLSDIQRRSLEKSLHNTKAALVVHGGTIMSILEAFSEPKEEFYHWQVKNCRGYRTCWDGTDKGGVRLYETVYFSPYTGLSAGSDLR